MVDALLISDLTNIRWMTGFTGSNGWMVLTHEHLTPITVSFSRLMFAPMRDSTSNTPSRVGLVLTLRSMSSEPGAMEAATKKNAALEMSEGTTQSRGFNDCPPPMDTPRSSIVSFTLAAASIRSEWSRDRWGSSTGVVPSA